MQVKNGELEIDKNFLHMIPNQTWSIEEQIDKRDSIKTKSLWFLKDTVKRTKMQITDWEKILQNIYLIKDLLEHTKVFQNFMIRQQTSKK